MQLNNNDMSDAELEKLLKQVEQKEFEKLQHKTTIPTFYIKQLLHSPDNWQLGYTFFKRKYKDKKRNDDIAKLIAQIEVIALENTKAVLEESDYYVDLENEDPILYGGFSIRIRCSNNDLFKESERLNCLNFFKLCDCIQLRAYTKLLFENQQYEESFYCLNLASYIFGYGQKEVNSSSDFQKALSKRYENIGRKGGNNKGKNFEPVRQKILAYHDKHFTKKKDNGKFLYSNAKTARLIIKGLSIVEYAENTLANIIGEHRKHHFS